MISHWGLNDSKSSQVSSILLSTQTDFNNAVVLLFTSLPVPLLILLWLYQEYQFTIDIIVTFIFHSFFNSLTRSHYLSFFSLSFSFTLWSAGHSKVRNSPSSYFLLLLTVFRCGRLPEIRWSVCISKSQKSLCVSFSRRDVGLWSNFSFLQNFQWITLPAQSCQILYSFCDNLLHSPIMGLIVSSLSLHNLNLLFFASYLFLLWYS